MVRKPKERGDAQALALRAVMSQRAAILAAERASVRVRTVAYRATFKGAGIHLVGYDRDKHITSSEVVTDMSMIQLRVTRFAGAQWELKKVSAMRDVWFVLTVQVQS